MKKILLFLVAFCTFFGVVKAQNDATITADQIQYWVGEGENEVVIAITWCSNTQAALAWGYRFDGNATVFQALSAIAEADSRLTVFGFAPTNITYQDDVYNLTMQPNPEAEWGDDDYDAPMHSVNGAMGQVSMSAEAIYNNDFIKIGGYACGIMDAYWTSIVWTTEIVPATDPNAGEEVADATIDADQIEYWVGEGENEVIYIVQWCEPEIAFAWGYRFEGNEVTVGDMMNDIAEADSRFSYTGQGTNFVNDIMYVDEEYDLGLHGNSSTWFMYNVNGVLAGLGFEEQTVMDGDVVKYGVTECAIIGGTSWEDMTYTWTTPVTPVSDPNAGEEVVDATIAADSIMYWVGEGENEVVVAISWCSNTQAALAWGYRFHGEATVFEALTTIAAADSRLAVVGDAPSNVTYQDGELDLTMQPNPNAQWGDPDYDAPMHSINGLMGQSYMAAEPIHDGDFVKIGGSACGIFSDDWSSISWTTTINPATAPAEVGPSDETFDGVAGSEGCQGIHCQDPAILGWATTCTIERGRQNITTPGVFASYGTENDGVGAATESTADVVSLGDYGIAVLTFDIPIQNGDGYDFAVFENGLNNTFLELAFVEVSSDGVNYFRFSSVSNTPTNVQIDNNGGVDAIHLNNLAGKYRAGWGTPFDLEELAGTEGLDVNNITHIRLVDVVGCVDPRYATRDGRGHIINDPYPTPFASSGFDLDGVAVMNGWRPAAVQEYVENSHLNVYPNPCNTQVTVEAVIGEPVMLFNSVGTLVYRTNANDTTMTLNMSDYPAGLYIVKCGNRTARIVKM